MIVKEQGGVTIIGGGELCPAALETARHLAPTLVAADGGATAALAAGWRPAAVIGDMDSLEAATRAALPAKSIHHIAVQDSTDFDKALRNVEAPFILGIGLLGGRLDHELAVLSTLARHPDKTCVLIGGRDGRALAPPSLELCLPVGTRLSLFPLAAIRGQSIGLRWPIDGIELAPDRRVGTSNETSAPRVALRFSSANMLLILPREHLSPLLDALLAVAPRRGHQP